MATTITVTAFQTACAAVGDAIIAGNWETAAQQYAVAESINAGLEVELQDDASRIRRHESLEKLAKAIAFAEASSIKYADNRRFIKTRTSHSR